MKRLIINADDFGFTRGVNAGIIRAFERGILTSATLMANGDAFDEAVAMAGANPSLGVGIHLVAVGGRPVADAAEIPSLVDANGLLPRTLTDLIKLLTRRRVRVEHIEREFAAQIERVRRAGITPTHLDSHKHSHTQPLVMTALARVAKAFNIRAVRNPFERLRAPFVTGATARTRRGVYLKQAVMSAAVAPRARAFHRLVNEHGLRAPDFFCGVRLTGLLDAEAVRRVIEGLREGTTELMCHPALYDDELEQAETRLKRERQRELEALTDESVRRAVNSTGVQLINYGELTEHV
ncbi:MAG: carbohydrate deacetylase [Blastocatellia bacterium]